jgi:hypothetical protein
MADEAMQDDIEIREFGISGRGVFARRRFRTGETVFRWDLSRKIRRDEIDSLSAEERHFLNPFDEDYFVLMWPSETSSQERKSPATIVREARPSDSCADAALSTAARGQGRDA